VTARIVLVDVGMGNLRSVERALEETGQSVEMVRSGDPDVVRKADLIVFPGQGAFRDCARALDSGLREAITSHIRSGKPYLGICLGMQALFVSSEEADESCRGLSVFEGTVKRLVPSLGIKIPHMGWNTVEPTSNRAFLQREPEHFYFVHSFVVVPEDESLVAGTTEHGQRFVSAIAKDNLFAVQFHPEKSQGAGLALLGRVLRSFL
jgi:glutamine amidotransferase